MSKLPADDARRMAETADKLLREVERLRADIVRLHDRFTPFDPEEDGALLAPAYGKPPVTDLDQFFEAVSLARDEILGAEMHLKRIRAVVDLMAAGRLSTVNLNSILGR